MSNQIIKPETNDVIKHLYKNTRTVPNWPIKGVMFRDITPLFKHAECLKQMVTLFVEHFKTLDKKIDYIAGIEARGFMIGAAIAHELNIGFIPVRKQGKLPYKTISESYALEYANATIEVHKDAVKAGDNIIIIDDLIATGGTFLASINLFKRLNANILECACIIDLPDLLGSKKITKQGLDVFTLLEFSGE